MPPRALIALLLAVIAAAGLTLSLFMASGLPVTALSLAALAGSLLLWRRK